MAPPKPPSDRGNPAPTTPDPIEIAMEAEAGDAAPDSPARRVLLSQERLIGWEIADRRAGLALKASAALGVLLLVAALLVMAWQASQSRGLVVEAFSVPPELAAKGVTGEVVASQVLDRFNAQQRNSPSIRPRQDYASAWSDEAKVEIPQTGISIAELQRFLRQWLGHDRRLGGEIYRTPQGLQLTVRLSGAEADRIDGRDDDLSALFDAGAVALYGRLDPARRGFELSAQGDQAGARAMFARALRSDSADDRAYALLGLGRMAADPQQGIALEEAAARLSRDVGGAAYANAQGMANRQGHDELALDYLRRAITGLRAARHGSEQLPILLRQTQSDAARMTGDFSGAWAAWMDGPDARDLNQVQAPTVRALLLLGLHRPGAAVATLGESDDTVLALRSGRALNAAIARERGDWAEAYSQLEAVDRAISVLPPAETATRSATLSLQHIRIRPQMAEALAELGRHDEARALIATTPADCYLCLRIRGRVAARAGRPQEADRWYAQALAAGPSLPQAETEWAADLLARGDTAGALAKVAAAHKRGPRFADPLELWGESLLAQGDAKGAAAKFAEAAKLAPRWGRLHLKWGEALAKLGKADEARAKWRAAATMDLSVADRAALKVHGV